MVIDDLARTLRPIFRRPGASAVLVATMALGIGATTAVFSVLDAVLLRPAPYPDPEQLAELWSRDRDGSAFPRLDAERAAAWTRQTSLFSRVEQFVDRSMLVTGVAEPEEVRAVFVSPGLFHMLGFTPSEGRALVPDDARPDAPLVAIVSEAFRRRHLADQDLSQGPVIQLDDQTYTVVGTAPASFRYPRGLVAIWLPWRDAAVSAQPAHYVARLQPGMTPASARTLFDSLAARLDREAPRPEGWGVAPMFLSTPMVNADVRTSLWVLAGAAICVLLIACVNTANLLLVQATTRQRELGIRGALGATRGHLVRQLLAETTILAAVAAALGIALAYWSVDLIALILPSELSVFANAHPRVETRSLIFALVAALATWLLCGVGPALHASRARARLVAAERAGSGSRGARQVRNVLVIAEMSLSLVLLAGAGLFLRSLMNLMAVDPGFDAERLVTAEIRTPAVRFPTPESRAALLDDIERHLRLIPGVTGVTFATGLPPQSAITFASRLEAEGSDAPAHAGELIVPFAEADTAFFGTLGVPLLRGRAFTREELTDATRRVAVIDPHLADALWPQQDPIGRRFRLNPGRPWTTVIGVAGDVKLMGPDDRQYRYELYYPRPLLGRATHSLSIAVRTMRDPRAVVLPVREALRNANPDLPVTRVSPAETQFAEANAKPRFVLVLLSIFAGVAVALAVIGIYGVLSYSVAQRTREIGIRMALGARAVDVLNTVLREGAALAIVATGLGLWGVLATGRLAGSLLFGVTPADPGVLAAAAGLLILASLVAVLAPARRASRISPLRAIEPD